MNREELIKVFEDTKLKSLTTYEGNYRPSIKVTTSTYDSPKPKSRIVVENLDSVSALVKYGSIGRVAVLNMASPKRPGGGVRDGAKAQEECLFRCSNLISRIPESMYPLKDNEAIYTEDVVFFKDFYYNDMSPTYCDVITIAAVNLNGENIINNDFTNSDYIQLTKEKIKLMISSADSKVDTLILGAWGCGVFKNDPRSIAELFREVLVDLNYQNMFDKIVFAIIQDSNSVGNNYEIFKSVFN
jgi:uncharacterized protein (TIGR02452 family)